MLDTIKVKLKLTNLQKEFCFINGGACRFLYNEGLRQNIDSYNSTKKLLQYDDLTRMLDSLLKNSDFFMAQTM